MINHMTYQDRIAAADARIAQLEAELAQPPGKVLIYRATLSPIAGGYPAIDGPVLYGDQLLTRGVGYQVRGDVMQVDCRGEVSTFLAAWMELVEGVQRRKP